MSSVEHRRDFLERVVCFSIAKFGLDKAREVLERYRSLLEDASEKEHLYKFWALEAMNQNNRKETARLCSLIADDRLRMHAKNLLAIAEARQNKQSAAKAPLNPIDLPSIMLASRFSTLNML